MFKERINEVVKFYLLVYLLVIISPIRIAMS